MRIRPVETSGLPMPFQRRGQGPVIVGSPDPLAWANKADGAKHAWDFIANAARWNGQYIGALANTPNWTFTRASTGYAQTSAGVLTSFASGVPRITDKGILIEGARTNILTRSQEATTILSVSNGTLADDVTTAPDGTTTADSFTEAATTTTHWAYHTGVNGTSATTYSFSVFVKANGRNFVILNLQASANNYVSAVFNLATGAMTESSVGATSGTLINTAITALADGWYRITLIGSTTGALSFVMATAPAASGNAFTTLGLVSFLGSTSNSVYIWGWQAEAASFPSSYIPTTTASATRAADSLTVTGVTGLTHPLSLYAEIEPSSITGSSQEILQVDDGTSNERALLRRATQAIAVSVAGGVTQATPTSAASLSVGTVYKCAARFSTNSVRLALNGTLATEDTTATNPATPSVIRFGSAVGGGSSGYGYLRRAAIFSRALSDGELQALTT